MPRVGWYFGTQLLRVDDLPREWCPWHMFFYCEKCADVWMKRVHLDEPAIYCYRPMKCPYCRTHQEFLGMRGSLLNGYEQKAGYQPIELLALDFLCNSSEILDALP